MGAVTSIPRRIVNCDVAGPDRQTRFNRLEAYAARERAEVLFNINAAIALINHRDTSGIAPEALETILEALEGGERVILA